MASDPSTTPTSMSDFAALRSAFSTLSDIYASGGKAQVQGSGVKLARIPRHRWGELMSRAQSETLMIRTLIQGPGQRASVSGRKEVVLSVLAATRDGRRGFDIAALSVLGRGVIKDSIVVSSLDEDWREQLLAFLDWSAIDGVLAAAEGNNQRAMIGLVLQLAGIGRGKLSMIEAELPDEIDEAAQMVRGADWMKAGLPRFVSASSEALWYLMRLRSIHARMIKERKQGYYTSMGLASLYATGLSIKEIASATGLPVGLTEKLTPAPGAGPVHAARVGDIGEGFQALDKSADPRAVHCAARVWRGPAIFLHMIDRRLRIGAWARERLASGGDLVSIASDLKISRRDLVRILSVRQDDAQAERERFVNAIISPDLIRQAVS